MMRTMKLSVRSVAAELQEMMIIVKPNRSTARNVEQN